VMQCAFMSGTDLESGAQADTRASVTKCAKQIVRAPNESLLNA